MFEDKNQEDVVLFKSVQDIIDNGDGSLLEFVRQNISRL